MFASIRSTLARVGEAFRSKANALALAAVVGVASASSLFPVQVHAQDFAAGLAGTQTQILGYVTATLAFIVAIGLAVLGMVMVAKAVKWARKAG